MLSKANFHPGLGRYIFANWAWISYDGYPRPDHTPDERNGRTGHQRTQLTLVESPTPWGPFSIFHRDDDWKGADGSSGGCYMNMIDDLCVQGAPPLCMTL